jgi:UDP-3-O-[3-hydroxymyristoyl] glucosamine N-acyltransferase
MGVSVAEIAGYLECPFHGDGSIQLQRISNWEEADRASLIYCEGSERAARLPDALAAGCIVTTADIHRSGWNTIVSERPKLDFSRAALLLHPRPAGRGVCDPTAVVSPDAVLGQQVDLGPHVVVEAGARVGDRSILRAGVVVGEDCRIGSDCILHPRVVLYPGTELGCRVTLHAGVVLGADGFGYVFDGTSQVKFPQAGGIVIEDDVEIGANTTVDRGSLGMTRIGRGSKIDNLVQIAHNTQIGSSVIIASQTGISGSAVIEDRVVIAGQAGFGERIRVKEGAVIGGQAGVLPGKVLPGNQVYWGTPARPLREFKRILAHLSRLPQMRSELERLKKRLDRLLREKEKASQ